MIKRIVIAYLILIATFYSLVQQGMLKYPPNDDISGDYFIKSEKYLYSDSVNKNTLITVGSSLSAHYTLNNPNGNFVNLSMLGHSVTDGLDILMASRKLPGTVIVEENLFDNITDSALVNKLFFPVVGKLRSRLFFLQKRYKLHNLLSDKFFYIARQPLVIFAIHTHLYSVEKNNEIKKNGIPYNTQIQRDFIRNLKTDIHTTLNNKEFINAKAALLEKQINYLLQNHVRVILLTTPILKKLYDNPRAEYKDSLMNAMENRLHLTHIKPDNTDSYAPFLIHGDGMHMNQDGLNRYNVFLDSVLSAPPINL